MSAFWLLAAGLVLVAYGLFWWSLRQAAPADEQAQLAASLAAHRLRRQELERELQEGRIAPAQFKELLAELERELLDLPASDSAHVERGLKGLSAVTATLAVLPLLALGLYFSLGRLDLLGVQIGQSPSGPKSLEAGIERLEARLKANPDDPEGWVLLARSYQVLGRLAQAKTAYERALAQLPDNLDLKARYAELLAQLQGGDLRGEPASLLETILQADPKHPYALWLSGLAALHAGDRELARQRWLTLLKQLPPESEAANQLRETLAKAGLSAELPAAKPIQIRVRVQLAPDLAARARPEDPVYIFARAAEGPPMPLAIVRRQVKDLPLTVTLDDSAALMPQLKLSNFKRVVLGARVAKSGNAQGAPGDLEGWTSPLAIDEDKLNTLVIDKVRS